MAAIRKARGFMEPTTSPVTVLTTTAVTVTTVTAIIAAAVTLQVDL